MSLEEEAGSLSTRRRIALQTGLIEKPKWIKVVDELPQNIEVCMIKINNDIRELGYYGFRSGFHGDGKEWKYQDGVGIERVIGKVTHWSPIVWPED